MGCALPWDSALSGMNRCDDLGMKMRVVWVVLAVVMAVVLIVVALTQWDRASKILSVVSTLAAIAAVGVAVWQGRLAVAALTKKPEPAVVVEPVEEDGA